MDILQAVVLRWATAIDMYDHADWMSVKWIQNVLKDLHNEEGCLGRRMENFESVEGEVCIFYDKHILLDGANGVVRLFLATVIFISRSPPPTLDIL